MSDKLTPKKQTKDKDEVSEIELMFDYGINIEKRVIYLSEDIDSMTLELFLKGFDIMESLSKATITIEISSYGGNVYDMFGMIDRMRSSQCKVITRGFGKIMSAATFILAAGDERFMGEFSWFMMHELSSWESGKHSEMKNNMVHQENLQKSMYKLYEQLSVTKKKASYFSKLCGKDSFHPTQEVLKMGLIDAVIPVARRRDA